MSHSGAPQINFFFLSKGKDIRRGSKSSGIDTNWIPLCFFFISVGFCGVTTKDKRVYVCVPVCARIYLDIDVYIHMDVFIERCLEEYSPKC